MSGEASAHRHYGQFTESFDRFLKALDLAEEIQEKDLQQIITQNIGVLLMDVNQYDEALLYLEKGENYNFNSQTQWANHKNNLSIAYIYLGDLAKAEEKSWEALKIYNKGIIKAYAYMQLGIIRNEQKKNEEAKKYLQKSLQAASTENLQRLKAMCLLNLSQIAYQDDEFQEALHFVKESLEISKKI